LKISAQNIITNKKCTLNRSEIQS